MEERQKAEEEEKRKQEELEKKRKLQQEQQQKRDLINSSIKKMSNKLASSAKKMISKQSSLQTFTASPMKKNIEEATPKYVPVLSSSMKELETIKQMDTEEKLMLKKQIKAPAQVFISFN